jgi:hypothetical protein
MSAEDCGCGFGYVCDAEHRCACGRTFKSKSALLNHNTRSHTTLPVREVVMPAYSAVVNGKWHWFPGAWEEDMSRCGHAFAGNREPDYEAEWCGQCKRLGPKTLMYDPLTRRFSA